MFTSRTLSSLSIKLCLSLIDLQLTVHDEATVPTLKEALEEVSENSKGYIDLLRQSLEIRRANALATINRVRSNKTVSSTSFYVSTVLTYGCHKQASANQIRTDMMEGLLLSK